MKEKLYVDAPQGNNDFFDLAFAKLFLKKYVAYCPLWTNIRGHYIVEGVRASNSMVEGYFSRVKNINLKGQRNVRPTEYIRCSYSYVRAKINELNRIPVEKAKQIKGKTVQGLFEDKLRHTPKADKIKATPLLMPRQRIKYNDNLLKRSSLASQVIIGIYDYIFDIIHSASSTHSGHLLTWTN